MGIKATSIDGITHHITAVRARWDFEMSKCQGEPDPA